MLIREPPRDDGPTRRVSLRASVDELDVSAIARLFGGGGHRQAAGFSSEASRRGDHRVHPPGIRRPTCPPRALEPAGVALVDKPAGPSSFAIVAQIRRMTGARTGHAGTLDPFATGLLLVLSGAATKLAPWLVGLDKRYVTEVDLTARTSTGDPEGEIVETREPPAAAELERRLAGLRGEIELPVPAASAVKIGGERAYRLRRRGVEVEMPLRRSTVHALDVVAYDGRRA